MGTGRESVVTLVPEENKKSIKIRFFIQFHTGWQGRPRKDVSKHGIL